MKILLIILLTFNFASISFSAEELSNCQKQETDSLWTESYDCAQGSVQVGYGLITESVAVNQEGKTTVEYNRTPKGEVNLKFLKQLRQLKN